jgi:hypothetical protein
MPRAPPVIKAALLSMVIDELMIAAFGDWLPVWSNFPNFTP